MTLGTKVKLGLALILAMFVALSTFAIDRIGVMARHFDGFTDTIIPTLSLSSEMNVVLDKLRVLEAYHILEQDPDKMKSLRVEIEKLQARMFMLAAEYRTVTNDPAQHAVVDGLIADMRTYMISFEILRRTSEENRTTEAFDLLRASAPDHARLLDRLADLDDLSRTAAEQAGEAAMEVAEQARLGAMLAVAVLAAIFLALIVYSSRDILVPMRRIIASIDQLALGNLAAPIPLVKRHDELGDVARALEHFRDNAIEKERLQKQERDDLEFARRVQLASVPRRFPAYPDRPEIDLYGRLTPTRAVGGDFFDYYFLDQRRLVFTVGDASGKGIASAMFVGMARSALKSESVRTFDPAITLGEANRVIATDNETMMFMTTFYGVLDVETGELLYANAGHTPPYLLKQDVGAHPIVLHAGVPLGVVEEFSFEPVHTKLSPGDAIVLYTDGVTEAADVHGALFGDDRLIETLDAHERLSCVEIVDGVFGAVQAFSTGAPQADDIAVLVVRYAGPARPVTG
jgi:serine phosphatase RsbU (regulator of sigma subunit)